MPRPGVKLAVEELDKIGTKNMVQLVDSVIIK